MLLHDDVTKIYIEIICIDLYSEIFKTKILRSYIYYNMCITVYYVGWMLLSYEILPSVYKLILDPTVYTTWTVVLDWFISVILNMIVL